MLFEWKKPNFSVKGTRRQKGIRHWHLKIYYYCYDIYIFFETSKSFCFLGVRTQARDSEFIFGT